MSQPKISLVVIYRRPGAGLLSLLRSVKVHVAQIVLVNTGPDEANVDISFDERGLPPIWHASYRCPLEWTASNGLKYIGDFAQARNHAHGMAAHDWHLTLDADDELSELPSRLDELIARVLAVDPLTTAIAFPYQFSEEVVQRRLRLIKWSAGWRWRGRLHEELHPLPGNPGHCAEIADIGVRHHGDLEASAIRDRDLVQSLYNRGLATPREIVAHAGALAADGLLLGASRAARRAFDLEPEGDNALAAKLLAGVCLADAGLEADAAIEFAGAMALDAGSHWAPALLGQLYAAAQQYDAAADYMHLAQQRMRHPDPLDWLLKSRSESLFYSLIDVTSHLHNEHHAAQSSKMIADSRGNGEGLDILCPGPAPWGPNAAETRGVGGSEQAVIYLAPHLPDAVVWASPLDEPPGEYNGVPWHDIDRFSPDFGRRPIVVWRAAELLSQLRDETDRRLVFWAHDVPHAADLGHYLKADAVLCLSQFHHDLFVGIGVPEERLWRIRNGIDRRTVEAALEGRPERDPHACFYGSSANRGLAFLLELWPRVRDAVPDATLHIAYDLRHLARIGAEPRARRLARAIAERCETLRPLGVHLYGGLPHPKLLELEASCGVWAYPSLFPEVSCITAMETAAMGLEPVTTTAGALPETVIDGVLLDANRVKAESVLSAHGPEWEKLWTDRTGEVWWLSPFGPDALVLREHHTTYVERLIGALEDPLDEGERRYMAERALEMYDWAGAAPAFLRACRGER